MQIRLDEKMALITGASSGIGLATARRFARCGANLFLTGRNQQALARLQKELQAQGSTVHILAGDLSRADFRQLLIGELEKRMGQLDVLVNCAGVIQLDRVDQFQLEEYEQLMNINLTAAIHLTALAVPLLKASKGNVVNVSSVAGLRSFAGILSYCVSKAGLDQFTRCAALELAPSGIRVNAVNPGVVVTRLHTRKAMDPAAYDQFLAHSQQTHPLGRVGTPEEVADLIAFLASDRAGWITGVTCSIDGGRALTCAR